MYSQFDSHISVVHLEHTPFVYDRKEAFSFRADKSKHFHWLQKLCFKILKWLEAYDQGEGIKIDRYDIGENGSTFINKLFSQYENVYDILSVRPTRILIGTKDFAELMRSAESTQYFSFSAEYKYKERGNGDPVRNQFLCPYTILNMQVEVIPWMKGCVILP